MRHHGVLAGLMVLPLLAAPVLAADPPARPGAVPGPAMPSLTAPGPATPAAPALSPLPPLAALPDLPADEPTPDWFNRFEGVMGRSAQFEFRTNLLETALLVAFFGGGVAAAGTAFVAVVGTSSALYLGHEYLWQRAFPEHAPDTIHPEDEHATAKSLTYRVAHTLRAMALGAAFGGASLATTALYTGTLVAAETAIAVLNDLAYGRLRRMMSHVGDVGE